jgi:hypothetical protein
MRRILISLACLLLATNAWAESITFDFNNGIGADFAVRNDANAYTVLTSGPTVRAFKGSDDGSVSPNDGLQGGIVSLFQLDGDFTVTVDFLLNDFPYPSFNQQINASLLAVVNDSGDLAEVLRFRLNGRDRAELFANIPFQDLPINTGDLSGRYRLVRQGTTVTGYYASGNSGMFVELASAFGLAGPAQVQLLGAQGPNAAGSRPNTALDVEFDNLVIEADRIIGLTTVPEPASLVLWLSLLGCAFLKPAIRPQQ